MRAFVRRHAVVILFVIVIVSLFFGTRRIEDVASENRRIAQTAQEVAQLVADQARSGHVELCESLDQRRHALVALFRTVIDDAYPNDPPAKRIVMARLDAYDAARTANCADVPAT
jgi:uncharacterized membrane protein affecting hemolysin expression